MSRNCLRIIRPSAPEKGRSLFQTVESHGKEIRLAVNELTTNCSNPTLGQSISLTTHPHFGSTDDSDVRLAWFVVNIFIFAQFATKEIKSLTDAFDWFFRDKVRSESFIRSFSKASLSAAEALLLSIDYNATLLDLLPYILEPCDPSNRLRSISNPSEKKKLGKKRAKGSFYTPSDVARSMVHECTKDNKQLIRIIDPACGTGVFLREYLLLKAAEGPIDERAINGVYGIDLCKTSLDSSVFVIFAYFFHKYYSDVDVSPYSKWLTLRTNFASGNTLKLTKHKSDQRNDNKVDHASILLSESKTDICLNLTTCNEAISISDIFPTSCGEFDVVILNPPYTTQPYDHSLNNWKTFEGLSSGSSAKCYLAFLETMWEFLDCKGKAAAVCPLSIASSEDGQTKRWRQAAFKNGGQWKMLFYDREPHALFGEDVKTRNAIIFIDKNDDNSSFETSRLLKWTSADRHIFTNFSRTVKVPSTLCKTIIPKIGNDAEVRLYSTLYTQHNTDPIAKVGKRRILNAIAETSNSTSVYVSSTAYNFLNVFMTVPSEKNFTRPFSTSPVNVFETKSKRNAFATYAIMASNVAFWLWHIEGDGFHVTGSFLRRLPILPSLKEDISTLATYGELLWEGAQKNAQANVNGGRLTLSHKPINEHLLKKIDEIILSSVGIPSLYVDVIKRFKEDVVLIDGKKRMNSPHTRYNRVAI